MTTVNQETTTQDARELALLLEIGTEEIPARFLPVAVAELQSIAAAVFTEYRIARREIRSYATPRRLVLVLKGVAPLQSDAVREVFGPSKKVAYDEYGAPTKAAAGFAASLGIPVSELVIKTKGKGEYVAAVISETGAETKGVLPEIFKKIILSLRFPKSMRWGSGSMLFVRPIHWIVALCGPEAIPFEIDGIKSGNMTRGHRFLSPASFQIKEVSAYMNLLENNFVILDQERREKTIRTGVSEFAAKSGGQPVADDGLLETVNFLV
jgi:glycyl-tRNA synthetase beta chain